jgi:hypothetical protein
MDSAGSTGGPPPPPPGAQPGSGPWAHCVEGDFSNCGAAPWCIYIGRGATQNGFCTTDGCVNPAADCTPPPVGSTATPTCVDINAGAASICVLDCSSGTCPTGMTCELVNYGATVIQTCI